MNWLYASNQMETSRGRFTYNEFIHPALAKPLMSIGEAP